MEESEYEIVVKIRDELSALMETYERNHAIKTCKELGHVLTLSLKEEEFSQMDINKSEFYHFGILPSSCIHSLDKDQYSSIYKPREFCECGSREWKESTMKMLEDLNGYEFPKKRVHKCVSCDSVRMADHISGASTM